MVMNPMIESKKSPTKQIQLDDRNGTHFAKILNQFPFPQTKPPSHFGPRVFLWESHPKSYLTNKKAISKGKDHLPTIHLFSLYSVYPHKVTVTNEGLG